MDRVEKEYESFNKFSTSLSQKLIATIEGKMKPELVTVRQFCEKMMEADSKEIFPKGVSEPQTPAKLKSNSPVTRTKHERKDGVKRKETSPKKLPSEPENSAFVSACKEQQKEQRRTIPIQYSQTKSLIPAERVSKTKDHHDVAMKQTFRNVGSPISPLDSFRGRVKDNFMDETFFNKDMAQVFSKKCENLLHAPDMGAGKGRKISRRTETRVENGIKTELTYENDVLVKKCVNGILVNIKSSKHR